MKIVKMFGGFANQLFMYAFFLQIRKCFDADVYIHDDVSYDLTLCIKDVFELDWPEARYRDVHRIGEVKGNIFDSIRRRIFGFKKSYYEQNEMVDDSQIIGNVKRNQYLCGYWQSYNYFCKVENEVREKYDFTAYLTKLANGDKGDRLIAGKNSFLRDEIVTNHSVGIHVRGGDYRNEDLNKVYGGICTKEYYRCAINRILEQEAAPIFYVFSNDESYVGDILSNLDIEYKVVDINNEINYSHLDIYLMQFCEYLVIANSSFSWWGAFLNERKKCVYCPEKWLNTKNVWGIQKNDWIKVSSAGDVLA